MDYLYNYVSLYKIINNENFQRYMIKIKSKLDILHSFHKKYISKEEYYNNLNIEIEKKIIERYDKIKNIVNKYNHITVVNGIEIIQFDKLLYLINNSIYELINKKTDFFFVPIHGDCQFNNILYNELIDDIVFIDPRGYYGNSIIYGIPEYDDAKLLFALSGYDEFDNRFINELNIKGNEIYIDFNIIDKDIINKKDLTTLLMLSIWLGNSHSFKNNEYKTIYSYFIALYFGTLYFSRPSTNL
jgi:thiamine kinase-like enzyme